jgi:putative oxidoreductase
MTNPLLSSRTNDVVLLAGRLLLATIFLHEGLAKLGNYAGSAAYARAFGVPDGMLPIAIAVELGCGLLVVFGMFARPAAFLLVGFCLVTAVLFHNNYTELNQLLHFEKNLAIAGGLLTLVVAGPGQYSLRH